MNKLFKDKNYFTEHDIKGENYFFELHMGIVAPVKSFCQSFKCSTSNMAKSKIKWSEV